ncbi:hypothetical protein [Flavihumibacter solisilvae]|nr:hypothetical protein [Flavihumibacter solisilvae]
MNYILSTLLLLITTTTYSQDCTKALLAHKPGTWKAGQQGSIVNVKAADLAKEKSVIAAIHKMVSASYKPTGCQISYSTVYGKGLPAASNWIADPYHYSMYVLRYLCDQQSADKSKYYVDYSTPTTVNITANVMYWLNNLYAADIATDDFRGYLKLKAMPVKKDDYYFMGEEVVGDSHLENKIKEYRWLITYGDTLPFSIISRKDYLLIQRKRLEKAVKENPGEKTYLDQYFKNIDQYCRLPHSPASRIRVINYLNC